MHFLACYLICQEFAIKQWHATESNAKNSWLCHDRLVHVWRRLQKLISPRCRTQIFIVILFIARLLPCTYRVETQTFYKYYSYRELRTARYKSSTSQSVFSLSLCLPLSALAAWNEILSSSVCGYYTGGARALSSWIISLNPAPPFISRRRRVCFEKIKTHRDTYTSVAASDGLNRRFWAEFVKWNYILFKHYNPSR